MKEVYGDLWAYEGRKGFKICITTNGFIKKDGWGVTGAGCAQQATERYPDFPRLLGLSLRTKCNVVSEILPGILAFPVKHNWFEDADIDLIAKSAKELARRATAKPGTKYIVPRPGCGNGHLSWKIVKPVMVKYFGKLDNIFLIATEEEREHARESKTSGRVGKTGITIQKSGAGDLRTGRTADTTDLAVCADPARTKRTAKGKTVSTR